MNLLFMENIMIKKSNVFLIIVLSFTCVWFGTIVEQLRINLTTNDPILELKNENVYLQNELEKCFLLLNKKDDDNIDVDTLKEYDMNNIINRILIREGIYSNDVNDLGGETVYGITRKYEPDSKIWPLIDDLKKDLCKHHKIKNLNNLSNSLIAGNIKANKKIKELAIDYYQTYYNKLDLDNIKYGPLKEYIFDMIVNNGEEQTVLIWSIAINALNRPRIGKDLKYDDELKFDKILIKYSNKFYNNNKCKKLLKLIKILRANRYITIADKRHGNRKFLNGWLKRVDI